MVTYLFGTGSRRDRRVCVSVVGMVTGRVKECKDVPG